MITEKLEKVVADNSFYSCFIHDIKRPNELVKILDKFIFLITKTIEEEFHNKKVDTKISNHRNFERIQSELLNVEKILEPFFSSKEKIKGEHEVIAVSSFIHSMRFNFKVIIDDGGGRKFLEKNFPELKDKLVGTVNFLSECHCLYGLFEKEEIINLLCEIDKSKFRCGKNIIQKVKKQVRDCKQYGY